MQSNMKGINWIGLGTFVRREIQRTFRVVIQTLVAPVISAALYIFIFGTVIGSSIEEIGGAPYITFVFPGILMLSIINASFASASSALYFMRFTRGIEEILIAPFSYIEMIFGFVFAAVIRSLMVAFLIILVGLLFDAVTLNSPLEFVFYISAVSAIFALLGIIVALWAEGFEQLQMLNTFIITPFTYLGGIFYSLSMLPSFAQQITLLNPFFYFINGIRHSMIGISEADPYIGLTVILVLLCGLGALVTHLFRIGWKIRA
jgi:ABC-2 type transport system permease protein